MNESDQLHPEILAMIADNLDYQARALHNEADRIADEAENIRVIKKELQNQE